MKEFNAVSGAGHFVRHFDSAAVAFERFADGGIEVGRDFDGNAGERVHEFGETGERGVRLSQVEELQVTAALLREAAQSAEERRVVEAALQRILSEYSTGDAPR